MKPLPTTEQAIVLRTDFSDESAWASLHRTLLGENDAGAQAYVDIIDDPAYSGASPTALLAYIGDGYKESFLVIADHLTFTEPERPLLVIDLLHDRGRAFRVVPSHLADVENNLSISNMDFTDFADSVDDDGVFRGFPGDRVNRIRVPRSSYSCRPTVLGRVLIWIYKVFRRRPKA